MMEMISLDSNNRFYRLFAEHRLKIRFLIVGVWNTLFGYMVYIGIEIWFSALFKSRFSAYMGAMILSNAFSILNAFIFHKYYTFRSRIKGIKILSEFLRFTLTYIVSICLSLLLLPLFVEIFRLNPKLAGLAVIFCCVLVSYVGHRYFSFKSTG